MTMIFKVFKVGILTPKQFIIPDAARDHTGGKEGLAPLRTTALIEGGIVPRERPVDGNPRCNLQVTQVTFSVDQRAA